MMEEELIPYKEALALKELGFDEPCLYGYDTFGVLISSSARWENWNKSLQLVSAPLFQQAFRWFSDKYNLDHRYMGFYNVRNFMLTDFQMETAIIKKLIDLAIGNPIKK